MKKRGKAAENTPEEVARMVTEHVERLNRERPGWFNEIRLEQDSVLVSFPFNAEDTLGHFHEMEIAWRTAIRVLRLMDKEKKR